MEKINLDEGYLFGIGVFETIAIVNGMPVFLDQHMKRLNSAVEQLEIHNLEYKSKIDTNYIMKYLQERPKNHGVLKIVVSKENIVFSTRENIYTKEDYNRGFHVVCSEVLRNETSLLTYFKTTNYAENILEKRKAKKNGIDEPIFINTKGQIAEGATSNIFFIKKNQIITPKLECGMLNGILRSFIIEHYDVKEEIVKKEEIEQFDEMFLTNSLLGVMSVYRFGDKVFSKREESDRIMAEYQKLGWVEKLR